MSAEYVATCDICVPTPEETIAVKAGDPLTMADAGTLTSMLRMGQAAEASDYVPQSEPKPTKKTKGR